jgi:hypothetical protein
MLRITDHSVLLEAHRNDIRYAARDFDHCRWPLERLSWLRPGARPILDKVGQFDEATTEYDLCERR